MTSLLFSAILLAAPPPEPTPPIYSGTIQQTPQGLILKPQGSKPPFLLAFTDSKAEGQFSKLDGVAVYVVGRTGVRGMQPLLLVSWWKEK